MIELEKGEHRAVVDPVGGAVVRYDVGDVPVLAHDVGDDLRAYRGVLLAPWPNRLADGRWSWRGQDLHLPCNDHTGVRSALHGLVHDQAFTEVSRSEDHVELRLVLQPGAGYPFELRLSADYRLTGDALQCSLRAENTGEDNAPVGLGVHPYLDTGGPVDDVRLVLPVASLVATDEQWRETGRVPAAEAGVDGNDVLGGTELDASFSDVVQDAEGRSTAEVHRADGSVVRVVAGPTCRWWVVYTSHGLPGAARRRSIAVEPMTCGANALATGEVDVLEPGESLALEWSFALR